MNLREDAIKIAKLSGMGLLKGVELASKAGKEMNNEVHHILGAANSLANSFEGGVKWEPVASNVAKKVTNKGFDLVGSLAKTGISKLR